MRKIGVICPLTYCARKSAIDRCWEDGSVTHARDDVCQMPSNEAKNQLYTNGQTVLEAKTRQEWPYDAYPHPHQHDPERDGHLFDHFVKQVRPLICPMLQASRYCPTEVDIILSTLKSNRAGMHCCLGISAMHLKATQSFSDALIEADIARHGLVTIAELRDAIKTDATSIGVLQTILLIIFLQCLVGKPGDVFLRLAWNYHFRVAIYLIRQTQPSSTFTIAMASWIDIIGATMLGTRPEFIEVYHQKRSKGVSSGLAELMGCEDQVMYFIAAIAELEASKGETFSAQTLAARTHQLEHEMDTAKLHCHTLPHVHASTKARTCVTALFRIAARLHLWSLTPIFDRTHERIIGLVDTFSNVMNHMPDDPQGLERSLIWPLLVTGSIALPGSAFREMFASRTQNLGSASEYGSYGKLRVILNEIWLVDDQAFAQGRVQRIHWRQVVESKDWDFLAI